MFGKIFQFEVIDLAHGGILGRKNMEKKAIALKFGVLTGLCLSLFACGSMKTTSETLTTPPPASGKPQAQLLWRSAQERPLWRKSDPTLEGGFLYFVGASKLLATKELAQAAAMADSTKIITQYLRDIAKNKFESEWASIAELPLKIDPADASLQYQKILSENMSNQLNAYDEYIEKWELENRIVWKAHVLVRLPNWVIDKSLKTTAQENLKIAVEKAMSASNERARIEAEEVVRYWRAMEDKGFYDALSKNWK